MTFCPGAFRAKPIKDAGTKACRAQVESQGRRAAPARGGPGRDVILKGALGDPLWQPLSVLRAAAILAKELQIPVIAVAQLSRAPESRPDKRPTLSDPRESGSIENDAGLVAPLCGDEFGATETQGEAEVIQARYRNGPVGRVSLGFVGEGTRFSDLTSG